MKQRFLVLVLAVSCAGGALAPAPSATVLGRDAGVEAAREMIDRGFADLMTLVPPEARDQDSPLWPLHGIGLFRQRAVRWASIHGREYRAIEPGSPDGGWLAIVPHDSPVLDRMASTMQMDGTASIHVVIIQPVAISRWWAGIFLTHELSHLADRVTGAESRTPTADQFQMGEWRAYNLELMAADLVSAGQLRVALGGWIASRRLNSWRSLRSAVIDEAATLEAAFAGVVTPDEALSPHERRLRGGFFAIALVLHYGLAVGAEPEEVAARIHDIGRALMR